MGESVPVLRRMLAKIKLSSAGCWVWQGKRNHYGYGVVWHEGKERLAHIVMWEEHHGMPVPAGLELDHVCRVRACIRPTAEHLEAVTHKINMQRSPLVGRTRKLPTHCPKNHPYSEENTAYKISGKYTRRRCKSCHRDAERLRRAQNGY